MDRRRTLAFTCFAANAILGLALGIAYLVSPSAMARQEAAVRAALPALGSGEQALLLALMRAGGVLLGAAGIAAFLVLARPFRAGERWAASALRGEQLALAAGAFAVATVLVLAGVLPPWGAALASLLLPIAGWAVMAPHPRIRSLVPHHAR
jgi:hypothetical protein